MRTIRIGQDQESIQRISYKLRFRHQYVVGMTGMGKSSLIRSFLHQDSYGHHAIIYLDPSGMEVRKMLGVLNPNRKIYYCSISSPVSLNPLLQPFHPEVIAANLIEILNQISTVLTDNVRLTLAMREVLTDVVCNVLRRLKRPTLDDVVTELERRAGDLPKEERDTALRTTKRITLLTRDPRFAKIVNSSNVLPVSQIVEEGLILVVDCHGMTDEQLLMTGNIVTHSVKAYFAHAKMEEYPPLALYVDEFTNFINPNFKRVLREGRKYNISVLLAQQDHAPVKNSRQASELLHIILSNFGTIISYRVGAYEAVELSRAFTKKPPNEFKNLDDFHVLARLGKDEFLLKVPRPPIPREIHFLPRPKPFEIRWGSYETS